LLEESRRRHGFVKKREGEVGVVGELGRELFGKGGEEKEEKGVRKGYSEEEERLRLLKGNSGR